MSTHPSGLDLVEVLWEIEQIKQLKSRYFRFIDTKDWDGFRGLFTEDCQHLLPVESADRPYLTNDEYFPATIGALSEGFTVHHGHMPEITILSSTEAEGIWAMFDYVDTTHEQGRTRMHGYGHYHETYRKGADGQWRISSKDNRRSRIDQLP